MATNRATENFVAYFKEIRRQIGEQFDESLFKERLNSDANFAVVAGNLANLKCAFDRAIKASGDKTFKQVHPNFPADFKTFSIAWVAFVPAYEAWKVPSFDLTEAEWESLLANLTPSPDGADDFEEDEAWDFDSEHHKAAHLVERLVEYSREKADWDGPQFNRMAEAYDWFKKRGLDLHRFEKRWRMVPPFFAIPQHVSDGYPVRDKAEGLYWLLNEAIKTYCFGNDGAAIAMCRAITEELIEEHYLKPADLTSKRGNIRTAEAKYEQLKKHNLGAKVDIANEVLHSGRLEISKFKKWKDPESFIREWLQSLKALIEGAPQSKR